MSADSEQPLVESLSDRELDVLGFLAQGKTNREIAAELVISLNTVKWYARQIYGKLGVGDREEAARRALALGLLPEQAADSLPPHNLPALLTAFVGRQDELTKLEEMLADPATRLITIVGPGGMGKTRLALQAAHQSLHHYPQTVTDGVTFISLAEVNDVQDVAELLLGTLNPAPVQGEGSVMKQLRRFLRKRQLLLLLDNVEHLAGQELSEVLDALLGAAPNLKVLATSRCRLDVRGEQLFWIEGLPLAVEDLDITQPDLERLLQVSSVIALFVQTARRAKPDFVLTEENALPIIEICRLLGGMPLGIELAAAWMGLLAPAELLEELAHSPDILRTGAGNVPAGQRSLRAVFDTSWALLGNQERRTLCCLSIFRGGFTRETAEAICGVSLSDLLALVNKCWLKRDEGGRFSIHELLRQYSAEALAARSELFASTRAQHSATYCRWLADEEETILGPQYQETLATLERELANIRVACLAAVATGHAELLHHALHTLGLFYRSQGRFRAGERMFASLLRTGDGDTGNAYDERRLRARILVWQAELQSLAGRDRGSDTPMPEALALVEQLEQAGQEMPYERMIISRVRGYRHLLQTRNTQVALDCFRDACEQARKVDSWWALAESQMALARVRRNLDQLAEAEEAVAEAIQLFRNAENVSALAEAITLRGNILARLGYAQEAIDLLQTEARLSGRNPYVEGYRLVNRAWAHFVLGQFDRAEQLAIRGIETFRENGIWVITMSYVAILGELRLHKGNYASADTTVAEMIPTVPDGNKQEAKAIASFLSGARALGEEQSAVAGNHLRRSLVAYKPTLDWNSIGVNACLALVARQGAQDKMVGWNYLMEDLQVAKATALPATLLSLAVAALLLADRGELVRGAEIYYRVWQEPFAQNSVWLRDVAGKELEGITSRLTQEGRAAAREHGARLNLQATAEMLLEEQQG